MNINLSNPVVFCLSFAAGLVTCSLGIFKLYNDSVHNTPSLRSCLRGEDVVFSPLFLLQGITTPPRLLFTVYESRRVGTGEKPYEYPFRRCHRFPSQTPRGRGTRALLLQSRLHCIALCHASRETTLCAACKNVLTTHRCMAQFQSGERTDLAPLVEAFFFVRAKADIFLSFS